jgi:hypothetical protein
MLGDGPIGSTPLGGMYRAAKPTDPNAGDPSQASGLPEPDQPSPPLPDLPPASTWTESPHAQPFAFDVSGAGFDQGYFDINSPRKAGPGPLPPTFGGPTGLSDTAAASRVR